MTSSDNVRLWYAPATVTRITIFKKVPPTMNNMNYESTWNEAEEKAREVALLAADDQEFSSAKSSRKAALKHILRDIIGLTEDSLISALVALGEATAQISLTLVHYVEHTYAGSQNASGDFQLDLDIQCDKAVFDAVKECGVFSTVASEETPEETKVGDGMYSLGCDPLDGSSIIDANFSVGSIFGIWPGDKLVGRKGREQEAAAVSLYGPRTVLCIALPKLSRVFEITLVDHRTSWHVSRDKIVIAPAGKVFAPGNLRATNDHEPYHNLLEYWTKNRYQLRYSGGMVPDVYHIFAKGKGIFTNVSSSAAKAKLRLLYEVAPLGLIVETAGGVAIQEDKDESVLDMVIEHTDQRLGVCFGGREEVEIYKTIMFATE